MALCHHSLTQTDTHWALMMYSVVVSAEWHFKTCFCSFFRIWQLVWMISVASTSSLKRDLRQLPCLWLLLMACQIIWTWSLLSRRYDIYPTGVISGFVLSPHAFSFKSLKKMHYYPHRTRLSSWSIPSSARSPGTLWPRPSVWHVPPPLSLTTASTCQSLWVPRAQPQCPTASQACR